MNVYIWYDLDCLHDWDHGLAIAQAHSKEEAIELILSYHPDQVPDSMERELHKTEPDVYPAEFGYWMHGGS